jgi:hypothetical protein
MQLVNYLLIHLHFLPKLMRNLKFQKNPSIKVQQESELPLILIQRPTENAGRQEAVLVVEIEKQTVSVGAVVEVVVPVGIRKLGLVRLPLELGVFPAAQSHVAGLQSVNLTDLVIVPTRLAVVVAHHQSEVVSNVARLFLSFHLHKCLLEFPKL